MLYDTEKQAFSCVEGGGINGFDFSINTVWLFALGDLKIFISLYLIILFLEYVSEPDTEVHRKIYEQRCSVL